MRPATPVHIRLDGYIAFSLEIGGLLLQQFDAGEFAQQRRLQSTRQRSPVACHQPVKPGSPIFVTVIPWPASSPLMRLTC
jgi:hypothetical protein